MPKTKADKHQITEVAIPAVIIVKQNILIARESAINSLADVVYRRGKRKGRSKEQLVVFRANVMVLFQQLRATFKNNHKKYKKIMELDRAIVSNRHMKFGELYEYFNILQNRMYELKITKLSRKELAEDDRW